MRKLYPSSEKVFDESVFRNPGMEYRGTPFWSWNTKLKKDRLEEQMEVLREMGMGGFHIHSRIGLDTEYLGNEFMEDVRFCVDYAKKNQMRCWLYDEDKWPSGYGAGFVTKNPEYKNRFLLFSPERKPDGYMRQNHPKEENRLANGGEGHLIARYQVELEDGNLRVYRRLRDEEPDGDAAWFAYLVVAETSPWFNNQSYGDTLNKKAMEEFTGQVHQKYFEEVGTEFGKTIPAIFTDEPQFSRKDCLDFAEGKEELKIPYTDDLEEGFQKTYGKSLLNALPEIFWELPEGVSKVRYLYHDYVAERFAQSYSDTLGAWCREHGIMLTGHMMEEPELGSQTGSLGEAMRQYRGFDLPGIDMLADFREYTTVKQAQSAAHQYGREGVLSELYGVTNWNFDFRGHKLQGDWQAALGVTQRVHHLCWMSMKGEAKRDYPAPIDEHSPWYRKYHLMETYFARINSVLTRGKAVVTVGVIHPIESYWLFYGPNDKTGRIRASMEAVFAGLTEQLLFDQTDFDFISEALLMDLYHEEADRKFHVGQMAYDVILVPQLRTIRSSTVEKLKKFARNGGKVCWIGALPSYIDAEKTEEDFDFGTVIPLERNAIYEAVKEWRLFSVEDEKGNPVSDRIAQVRKDGENYWIFLAQGKKKERASDPQEKHLLFEVKGDWQVERYDAMTGDHQPVSCQNHEDCSKCWISCYEDDSILLRLTPGKVGDQKPEWKEKDRTRHFTYLSGAMDYELGEPNVLLLDQAFFEIEGKKGGPLEALKIEDSLRMKYGYSLRTESFPQPWLRVGTESHGTRKLKLRYEFFAEIQTEKVKLAMETEHGWKIWLNGKAAVETDEFWIDRAFTVYRLPAIQEGRNFLEVELPFGEKTALEWAYLIGDFGVLTDGTNQTMTSSPSKLRFGDISRQKLPFYGGNIIYHRKINLEAKARVQIQIPNFEGALVSAQLKGVTEERCTWCSPYMIDLGDCEAGEYELDITCYGNRYNMFGQLHNCDRNEDYYGPYTWRSEGAVWSQEYQTKPAGILSSPLLFIE